MRNYNDSFTTPQASDLGEAANPEGCLRLVIHRGPEGHELEFARYSPLLLNARRAASAQASFPSRRARV
jgi:hypothetical protein